MEANKLILGTVQMGLPYGVNHGKMLARQTSFDILNLAIRNGVTQLDTAKSYGEAHEVIGSYLQEKPVERVEIITKFPHDPPVDPLGAVKGYMEELNVDTLEGIMFHSFTSYQGAKSRWHDFLRIKESELARQLGVSVYTNQEFEEVMNDPDIDLIQFPFNMLDNRLQRGELMKRAREKGKILHSRSAFLQGLFFMYKNQEHPIVRKLRPQLKRIVDLAERENISLEELALNYCLQQEEIDKVLIGVDSIDQLSINLEISNRPLGSHILREINTIKVDQVELLNPSLWNKV